MWIPHLPVNEILRFFLKYRENRLFMRISRIFILSLVVISAVSYAGEWVVAFAPDIPACSLGKWPCYQGPPVSFLGYIFELGAPKLLCLLPVIDLLSALLLLLKPRRTYLVLALFSFTSGMMHAFSQSDPYMYTKSGSGSWLHLFIMVLLFFMCLPLVLDEQMRLNPNWDDRLILRWLSPG